MGGSCSREDIKAAAEEACGHISGQARMRDEMVDRSTTVMGDDSKEVGGFRLFEIHGGSLTSLLAGALIGLVLGAAISGYLCRRRYNPWKKLATGHEQQLTGAPVVKLSRGEAVARLSSLQAGRRSPPPRRRRSSSNEAERPSRDSQRAIATLTSANTNLTDANAQLSLQLCAASRAALAVHSAPRFTPFSTDSRRVSTAPVDGRRTSTAPASGASARAQTDQAGDLFDTTRAAEAFIKGEKPTLS